MSFHIHDVDYEIKWGGAMQRCFNSPILCDAQRAFEDRLTFILAAYRAHVDKEPGDVFAIGM
ncbi:hypothetical protein RRF57_009732 [Xylaria bambusicola]|uniref:Uncharacterized protein n=1 Tax=Xylaria bambusicola TaxID=326684 RepID=A0AAN7UR28_9PEZI